MQIRIDTLHKIKYDRAFLWPIVPVPRQSSKTPYIFHAVSTQLVITVAIDSICGHLEIGVRRGAGMMMPKLSPTLRRRHDTLALRCCCYWRRSNADLRHMPQYWAHPAFNFRRQDFLFRSIGCFIHMSPLHNTTLNTFNFMENC